MVKQSERCKRIMKDKIIQFQIDERGSTLGLSESGKIYFQQVRRDKDKYGKLSIDVNIWKLLIDSPENE